MKAGVAALALSILVLAWALAGLSGILYFALFGLTAVPGLPLGFALFGRRHAGGWIAGTLFGYLLTALAWWAVVFVRVPSTFAFVVAWALGSVVSWLAATRLSAPAVALPAWGRRDTTALVLVLWLVPALVWAPFVNLGSRDAAGTRLYRAYFIADFVWHAALTAELAKEEQPPRNPFLAAQPVHYYWTYFRVPATIAAHTGIDVQDALKLNAIASALLLVAAIYLAAWAALPAWPFATAAAVALTIVAPSVEGLAVMADLLRRSHPLSELREINIDAAAAWRFKGLRIDNLPRAMWYTPQHAISCALGLMAVPVAMTGGVRARPAAIALAGLALAGSLTFNPLIGVMLCAVYGLTIVVDAARTHAALAGVLRHALAAVPVAFAFAWCTLNQVGEGALSVLHFGYWGPARNGTVPVFLLSFGPILVPMALGFWYGRTADPLPRAWPALIGVVLSILLMHLVTLTADQAWVGFRAGNIFFIMAPALVARGLAQLWKAGLERAAGGVALGVLLLGLPTTVIDAYNAQDVANLKMGPGFHWTVTVTAPEQEALDWIRAHTAPNAIVQHEPIVRGRETWSLIPTFAQRRMATGSPLALLPVPEYEDKNNLVQTMYATGDPRAAWQIAKGLKIDYLYVGATERGHYPGVAKFDNHAQYFSMVFANAEASVYAVRP